MFFNLLDALERHAPDTANDASAAEQTIEQEKMRDEPQNPPPACNVVAPASPPPTDESDLRGRGLPPTPELDRLLDDNSSEAWEAFIDGRCRQIQDHLPDAVARAALPRACPG